MFNTYRCNICYLAIFHKYNILNKHNRSTYQQSNNRINLAHVLNRNVKDDILANFTLELYFCATLL